MALVLLSHDQVLFLELRKLEKLSEDNVFEVDWLLELLGELMEAAFIWISNNKEIWDSNEENMTAEHLLDLKQVCVPFLSLFPYFWRSASSLVLFHFMFYHDACFLIYFILSMFPRTVCFGCPISSGNHNVRRILLQQPFVSHESNEISLSFSWTRP